MTDTRFSEDEQSLLNELNHGSSDAFTYLYNKYYRQLCTLSCTYLQDSERAKTWCSRYSSAFGKTSPPSTSRPA